MKKAILSSLLLIAISATTMASGASDINLIGGTIAPKQTLTIALDNLIPSVDYQMLCTIVDNNNAKNQVVISTYLIGSCAVSSYQMKTGSRTVNSKQTVLPFDKTPFAVWPLNNPGTGTCGFAIINTDQTDSISVNDCRAIALH